MVERGDRFVARLGLLDATTLVAGSMIGSGIFIVSADIARRLPAPGWLLLVWGLAGAITVSGALSYGRLAAAMPRAGGQYVYLSELYGPLWGFLFGWTLVLVIQTGTIAAVAVAFAKFAAVLWPALGASPPLFAVGSLGVSSVQVTAVAVILVLTALNVRGLEAGRAVQNVFTLAKVGTLVAVIGLGLAFGDVAARSANLARPAFAAGLSPSGIVVQLAAAMVGALFSADAWANVTFAAAEVRDARRTIPRALVLGSASVCLLYLVTNVAYLNVLPLVGADSGDVFARGIAHAAGDRVGTAVMERIAGGGVGTALMAVAIMVSTFGCANGIILAGARVAWAMAQDGLFFARAGRLNARHVPAAALWMQGILGVAIGSLGPLRRPARLRHHRGAAVLPAHGRRPRRPRAAHG